MAKVLFDSFQEASAFSKDLAMSSKTTCAVRKDGNRWYVDDPRVLENSSSGFNTDGIHHLTGTKYSPEGCDVDGFEQYDFNPPIGYCKTPSGSDGANEIIYDSDGFDRDGFDKEGFDKDGYDKKGRPRPF